MRPTCCRWCAAEILWLINDRTGRPAPIDADPVLDGNILRVGDDGYHVLGRGELEAADLVAHQLPFAARPERHTNHWRSCPNRKAVKEAYRR